MTKKARTPIIEYEDSFSIELPGERPPQERDRLADQAVVIAYDRIPSEEPRWRLRGLQFDRDEWARSGIRRWWAAHEVWFLAEGQLDRLVPEICRSYESPDPALPTILLCHRNTPLVSAREQIKAMKGSTERRHKDHAG